ncbi:glycoside hydrolase superfamily [Naematelia encephala]|uniref:mannan endo-1,4-beta-mannosidase n=1 Tax=Naematelia encephala TaxID=71784 RepID=A0A1Y2AI78_9TREE|nr:glycoside hydrolase superfamily [Naematelia encephala]
MSNLKPFSLATNSPGFVTAKNGKLYLDGQDYSFASFNNPELIGASDTEIEDIFRSLVAFARPVTRTYTLGVVSVNVDNSSAFIQGWNNDTQNWIYNEASFVKLDRVMALARKWGCKVIVPVINQDYGSQSTNYAGNWADLIQLYYNINGSNAYNESKAYNFWTDPYLIDATKKIYTKLLSRTNTLNGVMYAHDSTFLAVETGNELNLNMTPGFFPNTSLPAPGSWTTNIAQHIKSLAPNLLVMDGSLSRSNRTEDKFNATALVSPHVDLFSYHYYDVQYGQLPFYDIPADAAYIQSFGKTFVIGEHGFYPNTSQWDHFYKLQSCSPVAGSMVWGLRGHSDSGGFATHGEGGGIFSYHVPGWSPPVVADFDPLEQYVVAATYSASYQLLDQDVPFYPTPWAPTILSSNTTSNHTAYFQYIGGAWGEHYEIYHAPPNNDGEWRQVENSSRDNVGAGLANFTINPEGFGNGNGTWIMRGVGVPPLLPKGPWSNILTIM